MSLNPDDGGELEGMRWRKSEATAKGGQAFLRLLTLAETGDSGQAHTLARFMASTYNGQDFPYVLYDLRLVGIDVSDDILACLDALRWAQADLHTLVLNADQWGSTRQSGPAVLGHCVARPIVGPDPRP